jgi:hypothetical protein
VVVAVLTTKINFPIRFRLDHVIGILYGVGKPAEVLGWAALLFAGAAVAGILTACGLVAMVQLLRINAQANGKIRKYLFCISSLFPRCELLLKFWWILD